MECADAITRVGYNGATSLGIVCESLFRSEMDSDFHYKATCKWLLT